MKITGVNEMIAKLKMIAAKFPDHVAKALYQEAQIEMTESKRRVPWETTNLRKTGHVKQPVRSGRSISVQLAYGTSYAIIQHERLDFNHPRGGQAKYLESVLNESRPHMAGRIARRVDLTKTRLF